MNRTVRNIGLIALAAGALYLPARKLYDAVVSRRNNEGDRKNGQSREPRHLANALRGNHRPHRRNMSAKP